VTRAARQCRASARHAAEAHRAAGIAVPISRLAADWPIAENHASRSGRERGDSMRRESRESATARADNVADSDDEG